MRTLSSSSLRFLLTVLGATTALVVACSDTDPNYGPPGAIFNYEPIQGGGSSSTTSTGGDGAAPTDPKAAFAAVFDSTKPTCGSCHADPGGSAGTGKTFYAADATATLAIFKQKGYQAANSVFYTKGLHTGPALKDDQKKLVEAWVAAEAAGGGATDAGGGG